MDNNKVKVNESQQIRPDVIANKSILGSINGRTSWQDPEAFGLATDAELASVKAELTDDISGVEERSVARDQILSERIDQASIPAGYTETPLVLTYSDNTKLYSTVLVKGEVT